MDDVEPEQQVHDFFARALALVPQIANAVNAPVHNIYERENALKLVEAELITPKRSEAEVYLGCLLKAYIPTLKSTRDAKQTVYDLNEFITGQYKVRGVMPKFEVYSEAPPPAVMKFRSGSPVVGINNGNRLAMWKICEMELKRELGDDAIATALAASTARLQVKDEAMDVLCYELKKHDCNPYKNAAVFEFGGHLNNLDSNYLGRVEFPLIELFKSYQDYSPDMSATSSVSSSGHVSLENPIAFTSKKNLPEREKADYVIASNIFCKGAVDNKDNHDAEFIRNVFPHLSHNLKDGGKLVVSNTAVDGINYTDKPLWLKEIGLRVSEKNTPPLDNPSTNSGLYVLQRDYKLREPVAYSVEEYKHNRDPQQSRHQNYQDKESEKRTREDRDSWETKF